MRLEQILAQKQILAPQQILQASLLQLNTINLEQKILNELESNPVLEQAEPNTSEEDIAEKENGELDRDVDSPDDFDEYEPPNVYSKPEDKFNSPIVERVDFVELLVKQLDDTNLEEGEKLIGEEILWNLDDRGYLATELILIADRFWNG